MKKFLLVLLSLLLSACASVSPQQAQLNQCQSMMKGQAYQQALFACIIPANQGEPQAEYAVGYLYANGLGTAQDLQMAAFWVRKAAMQGYPDAVRALSVLDKQRSQKPSKGSSFNLG